jgi:hypothetical protein
MRRLVLRSLRGTSSTSSEVFPIRVGGYKSNYMGALAFDHALAQIESEARSLLHARQVHLCCVEKDIRTENLMRRLIWLLDLGMLSPSLVGMPLCQS